MKLFNRFLSRFRSQKPVPVAELMRRFDLEFVAGNYKKALKWCRKAAEQDVDVAFYHLGAMYAHGFGVEQDGQEALKWYLKAAEQNHTGAQFDIGDLYAGGMGVERDREKALEWYQRALDNGCEDAQYQIDELKESL